MRVTIHAIERYKNRIGSNESEEMIGEMIRHMWSFGTPCEKTEPDHRDSAQFRKFKEWIIVANGKIIVTLYQPYNFDVKFKIAA